MTEIGGHNKFDTCFECPHREPGCHDHCEGYQFRKKRRDERNERIRQAKYEQRITVITPIKRGQP